MKKVQIELALLALIFIFSLKANAQDSMNLLQIRQNLERLENQIDEQQTALQAINSKSAQTLEVSNRIVTWTEIVVGLSAFVIGAIAVVLAVAAVVGFREIGQIRKLRLQMETLSEEMKKEVLVVQQFREATKEDINILKKKIEEESKDMLKTIYLLNEGISSYNNGKLSDAESLFLNVIEINQEDYNAHCYLAQTYFGQNDYDLAIETNKKAIQLSDNPYRAYRMLGENHRRKGEYEEAIKALEKSNSLRKRQATYSSLGYTYFLKGDYNKAITSFRKALDLLIYSTPICGLAKCLVKKGQYQKAREYFKETISLAQKEISKGSNVVFPYYNLAFAHFALNNEEDCLEVLRTAFEKNLNPAVLREQLEGWKIMLNENGLSQDLLRECIKEFEERENLLVEPKI